MEREWADLTDRERVMAAKERAQTSFDHSARKSLDRIAEARSREEKLEMMMDSFIKAAARVWEALKQLLSKVWREMQPLIKLITDRYSQKHKKKMQADRIHQQRIQQEHQQEARMMISIYELQQYKQLQRHSGQRRK